jgi:hypothetical protein
VSFLLLLRDWGISDALIGPRERDRAQELVGLAPARRLGATRGHTQHIRVHPPLLALHVPPTLHTPLDYREGPQLRHVRGLSSLLPSWLTCLAGLAETGSSLILGRCCSAARSSWPPSSNAPGERAPCSSSRWAHAAAPARGPRNAHRAVHPPELLEPLRKRRDLDHRLAARREPGPHSHPRYRPRRRLRRGDIPAMLRTSRSHNRTPTSSLLGRCSRPTPPRAATRPTWLAATSRAETATRTCVAGS